jgi:hypothetical protein
MEVAMGQVGRPGLSAAGKAELWDRWRDGESISDIARALGKAPGSIFGTLRDRGGLAPPVADPRLAVPFDDRP